MPITMPTYDVSQLSALLPAFLNRLNDAQAQSYKMVLLAAPRESRYRQLIYSLGLQDLAAGAAAAKITGSRYLARLNGHAVAVDVSDRTGNPRIVSISAGPKINQAINAIESVKRLPDVQNADYELHTLSVPGAQTEAYWLKFVNGNNHRFVPYLTLNKKLQVGLAYDWADFVGPLEQAIKQAIAFYQNEMG